MKDILKQLYKESKRITLRAKERTHLRNAILSRMELSVTPPAAVPSRFVFFSYASYIPPRAYAASLLIAVFVFGGSLSVAAEHAVPGDTLYRVKTSVNEAFKTSLAVTDAAKMQIMRELATERLEEAEELAVNGELTVENKIVLEASLERHVDQFTNSAKKTQVKNKSKKETKNALEEVAKLETALEAHATVLSKLVAVSPEAETVAGKAKTEAAKVTEYRVDAEVKAALEEGNEADIAAEVELKRRAAESLLAKAKEAVESLSEEASGVADIRLKLIEAEEAFSKGEEKIEDEAVPDALVEFSKSYRVLQELMLTLSTSAFLNIDQVLTLNASLKDCVDDILASTTDMSLSGSTTPANTASSTAESVCSGVATTTSSSVSGTTTATTAVSAIGGSVSGESSVRATTSEVLNISNMLRR